jgi:hypothetical protein
MIASAAQYQGWPRPVHATRRREATARQRQFAASGDEDVLARLDPRQKRLSTCVYIALGVSLLRSRPQPV